ncbi:MAG: hypothetical protein WCW16_02645 [Candidatus Magasanikbacteria bacterium]
MTFFPPPVPNGYIYVPSDLFLSHGEDDRKGGLATVAKVSIENRGGTHYHIIETEEFPGLTYNWELDLGPQQEKLKKQFGSDRAHYEPDTRPTFN